MALLLGLALLVLGGATSANAISVDVLAMRGAALVEGEDTLWLKGGGRKSLAVMDVSVAMDDFDSEVDVVVVKNNRRRVSYKTDIANITRDGILTFKKHRIMYVKFHEKDKVPEPGVALLLGLGFGAAGIAARRRRA